MREILFRGKRVDNNEWVEGNYVYTPTSGHLIIPRDSFWDDYDGFCPEYQVDPDTVGQYTGQTCLHNKKPHKIFEGDIVTASNLSMPYEIVWDDWKALFMGRNGIYVVNTLWGYSITVIGNIHDNPELCPNRRRWRNESAN